MNKTKTIILIVLLLLVGSLCINAVTAKTYNTKAIKFRDSTNTSVVKYVGKGEYVTVFYNSKYSAQFETRNHFYINICNIHDPEDSGNYKLIKAKIKFTKKVNGKTKIVTKMYKPNKWGYIDKNNPKGWKPYSSIVTYKDA